MEVFVDLIISRFNYWIYIILMMIGLYGMISKNNFVKKLIGMSVFQTAIILFYVSISVKMGATIPILITHGSHETEQVTVSEPLHSGESSIHEDAQQRPGEEQSPGHETAFSDINPAEYANPLPHVLMLTAIVVGVATLGVALAVLQKIYGIYGTIEEDEILKQIE